MEIVCGLPDLPLAGLFLVVRIQSDLVRIVVQIDLVIQIPGDRGYTDVCLFGYIL